MTDIFTVTFSDISLCQEKLYQSKFLNNLWHWIIIDIYSDIELLLLYILTYINGNDSHLSRPFKAHIYIYIYERDLREGERETIIH